MPLAVENAAGTGVAVRLAGVTKTFATGDTRVTAADHVNLEIPAGSVVALTGPSGSGKSTLLHLLGAIESADSGDLRVGDVDLTTLRRGRLTAYRRSVGFVFQRYHLLPTLSALDNVLAPVLPYRVGFDKTARARELLDRVGLAGNLDSATGAEILDLLLDLRDQYGMTIVIATHDQHVAARCERLVRLRDGRVVDDIDLTGGEPPEATLARVDQLRL